MVYDCFTFFNEMDLLEIRLNVLSPVVDKFVLVEMDRTHSNEEKPLFFEENKERYAPFLDKIIHVKVTEYPDSKASWALENHQRQMIAPSLEQCTENDVIIVSDLDEIPDPDLVAAYKRGSFGAGLFRVRQIMHYYFVNYQKIGDKWWYGTMITRYGTIKSNNLTPQIIRDLRQSAEIPAIGTGGGGGSGGWHFSFLGGYDAIVKKVRSFAHQEFNNDTFCNEDIKRKVAKGLDIFNRPDHRFIPVRLTKSRYPAYLVENRKKYAPLIYPKVNFLRNWLTRMQAEAEAYGG